MKKLVLNALFMGIVSLAFAQPAFTEQTLTEVHQAFITDAPKAVAERTSLDFMMIGSNGQTRDYASFKALNESGSLVEWPVSDIKIKQEGKIAIVTGVTKHATAKFKVHERFTETFEYQKGKWVFLSAHYGTIQPTIDKVAEEAVIRNLENLEREAFLKNDTTTLLTQLWSPQMVIHAPANNISNLDNLKKRIATGKQNYARFDRKIENIAFNDNLAFVMGEEKLEPQGMSDNAGKTITRRYTNVWKNTDGNWRMIARQATIIKVE